MEQELTLTDNALNYLVHNFTFGKCIALECIDIISDNYIVDDKGGTVLFKFEKEISSLDQIHFEKIKYLLEVLDNWMRNNRCILEKIRENDWENDILKLCQLSNDKILFSPTYDEDKIKEYREQFLDIEFHNVHSFVNPDYTNKLKNLPYELKLKANSKYNLNDILLPFIRNAKEIIIIDPYIANWLNFRNLKILFKIIPKSICCKIKKFKLESDKPSAVKNDAIFNDFVKRSKMDGYKIELEFFELPEGKHVKHFDRHIITDKYKITLPGGFDCIDKDGYGNVIDDKLDIKEIVIKKIINN